jgi:hypothetical protein
VGRVTRRDEFRCQQGVPAEGCEAGSSGVTSNKERQPRRKLSPSS